MAKQSNAAPKKRGFFARLFGRREAVPKTARRNFAGARPVGSLASWQPQNWSADALARSDLDRLRARARSLARDNDYMRKFLNMVESNVIGRDGFALQMRVLLDNADKPDALANKAIEAAFSRWARRVRRYRPDVFYRPATAADSQRGAGRRSADSSYFRV